MSEENKLMKRKLLQGRKCAPCAYCKRMTYKDDLSVDHFIPKSRGGTTKVGNCVLSCFTCNNKKADKVLNHEHIVKGVLP